MSALLVILCSAVLFWFGIGLNPWWPAAWFAPLPLLLYAPRHSAGKTTLVTAVAVFLGSLAQWPQFHALHLPILSCLIIFGSIAFVITVATLLFRALLRRGTNWSALVVYPAFIVTVEYLHNILSVDGTAGNLAYTQLGFLSFLQIASLTGPWGMTFLLLLFPSTIAVAFYLRRSQPGLARMVAVVGLGIIALALVFGAIRLAQPRSTNTVKVGLVTSDLPANDDVADEGTPAKDLFERYAAQVEKLAQGGAQVVVLPEKLAVVLGQSSAELWQALADRTRAIIVAGVLRIDRPRRYNEASVYIPHASMQSYHKRSLLPPFESNITPGNSLLVFRADGRACGVAICKDMDFTPLSRNYGKEGVGLMLVPGWDFNVDRAAHGHIAIMRGVEDGFSIARAAKNGYLTVSDNRGRILAERRSDSADFPTLLVDVPAAPVATLYQKFGDWFAWLSIALCVLAILQLFRQRRSANSLPVTSRFLSQ
jgi:apolipoprotein N-acyltransferase